MFQKIKCLFKGHVGLKHETEYIRHYTRIPTGRGAFCRDPIHYEYHGRLYKCSRCGQLVLHHGIARWELEDLITTTLVDLPRGFAKLAFANWDYDIMRLYRRAL